MRKVAKLINYTTQDFASERDMELNDFRWEKRKSDFLPRFKNNGLLRIVSLRIWNKEGKYRMGYIFEYEDENAFKKCKPIWEELDALEAKDMAIKVNSDRGIVTDDVYL